jgi:hypothetical protein
VSDQGLKFCGAESGRAIFFNWAGRLLKEIHNYLFGLFPVPTAQEYTYLGITFSLMGSMKEAQTKNS